MHTITQRIYSEIMDLEDAIKAGDEAAYHMVEYKGLDHYLYLLKDAHRAIRGAQSTPALRQSYHHIDSWDEFVFGAEYERAIANILAQEELNYEHAAVIEGRKTA